MSKVAKSLSDLDALADEVLSKSVKDGDEDLKPEDISENVPENDTSAGNPDEEGVEEPTDDKKGAEEGEKDENDEDLEKCGNADADAVIKSEDSDTVTDEDDNEDDDDNEEDSIDNEDLEKSIKSDFTSEEEIKKGMEASEFLSSVVEILSKSLADTVGEIQINRDNSKHQTAILAKSLQAALSLNKSMAQEVSELKRENAELKKSITDGFDGITSILEEVLAQPVGMRKSVKNIQVMDRDFQKSLNGESATGIENLSKSQVLDILFSEMRAGNQAVTAGDIVAYESGAPLHAGLVALVNSKCR